MFDKKFQFSEIENIENVTFDNSLERFYNAGIVSTIKEDLQNSIDAKLNDADGPVKINLVIDEIDKDLLPGINELENHINSLRGFNTYIKKKVDYMKERISQKTVKVLTIEDSNTKGLSGAENGQSDNKNDTYGIYAYKKGVHFEEENEEKELKRGGSHGIGKIANNAASDIHLMYFANCDEYGNQHLGGKIHLIEHELNNEVYRDTGYYTKKKRSKYFPFKNDNNHPIFKKNSRGLKIIIPFLREEFSEPKDILRGVCDNFFISILNNTIEINITDKINGNHLKVNSSNIQNIVTDESFYETDLSQIKKHFTPLYVNTYINNEPKEIQITNNDEQFNFKLYFEYDEEIATGRVAIVKTMGMKIEDFKIKNNVRKPFNAVLIGSYKEDAYLKSLENESHTSISDENIKDPTEKKRARKFISNLNRKIADIIQEHTQANVIESGILDTQDLIYEIDSSFKNQLSGSSEKVLVKDKTIQKRKMAKEVRDGSNKAKQDQKKQRTQKRIPRKIRPSDTENDVNDIIITPTSNVSRITAGNTEHLTLNLRDIENSEKWIRGNISFVVVDGMGKEHSNEANLKENYESIKEKNKDLYYNFDENTIYNVNINEGVITLVMELLNNGVNSLKFLYKIEVESNDI